MTPQHEQQGASPDSRAASLPKQYRPREHEERVWARWVEAGAFRADPSRVVRGEAKGYCILIPPPNVTAALHLGHALNNTLQDVLVRAHRMMGHEALWMPGTDHAGIATQAVVEKRLRKEGKLKGPLRTSMTREAFVAEVQAYKDEYERVITGQLQKMGCSCDWARQRFTMDPICARAVYEAFFILFRDGLIYRGKRLVNWDPVLQTAVADDECYDEEVETSFWYLRYPLVHARGAQTERERAAGKPPPEDAVPVTWSELSARGYPGAENREPESQAYVTVATTRPETYLGDTGVAVNPRDPRAKALRGLSVELPLVGRVIPIIEDPYVVMPKGLGGREEETEDPKAEFATGFLKVTPAHDPNDYEIARRHNLAMINMMSPDGRVSDKHGWKDVGDAHLFVGRTMSEARKLVIKEFEARGLLEAIRPYRHTVKHSDRSKAVIEPYLSDQWYVKVTDDRMAGAALRAMSPEQRTTPGERGPVKTALSGGGASSVQGGDGDGSLRFHPARYARTFEIWHESIRDWCISRQLWWGHRIPVWTREPGTPRAPGLDALLERWEAEGRVAIRDEQVCVRNVGDREITSALAAAGFQQDSDVLDTWFSSALWPLSTMGWPDPDLAARESGIADFPDLLRAYNPTDVLCTAREIITLWVSRMTMFNRYFLGQGQGCGPVPFRDVFIHAVIQDGEGRKMSKSAGNGVDPLDIIDTHGADALRFTLCHMATNTQDVRMPVLKDEKGRNTSPKFDLGRNFATKVWNAARFAFEHLGAPLESGGESSLGLADRFILSRLAWGVSECERALGNYEFADYASTCYTLAWNDLCDWYLEAIKPTVRSSPTQRAVLRAALDAIVRLLHPVMPFVTEVIFEILSDFPGDPVRGIRLAPPRKGGVLATAGWPVVDASLRDPQAEAGFERVRHIVAAVREVRAGHGVSPKRRLTLHMPKVEIESLADGAALVCALAGLDRLTPVQPAGVSVPIMIEAREYRLSGLSDEPGLNHEAERTRLARQIAELEKSIATLEARLRNPGYTEKAPKAMVDETRAQLASKRAELDAARAARDAL
jgi:valyl-tRNA synthetase